MARKTRKIVWVIFWVIAFWIIGDLIAVLIPAYMAAHR